MKRWPKFRRQPDSPEISDLQRALERIERVVPLLQSYLELEDQEDDSVHRLSLVLSGIREEAVARLCADRDDDSAWTAKVLPWINELADQFGVDCILAQLPLWEAASLLRFEVPRQETSQVSTILAHARDLKSASQALSQLEDLYQRELNRLQSTGEGAEAEEDASFETTQRFSQIERDIRIAAMKIEAYALQEKWRRRDKRVRREIAAMRRRISILLRDGPAN